MRTVRISSPTVDRGEVDLATWLQSATDDDLEREGVERLRPLPPDATIEVDDAPAALDAVAAVAGLSLVRELVEMRRALPLEPELTSGPPLATRPFRAGVDDLAVIEVNNRAFAWHPEQADWTVDDLAARRDEPWFDPCGLLLAHDTAVRGAGDVGGDGGGSGRLLGFCWTKVHHEEVPPAGEIFVIGVDPVAHGRGLGRGLVLAGLAHLSGLGLRHGLLWTEADNAPAMGLYRSLGFRVARRHCWYAGSGAEG